MSGTQMGTIVFSVIFAILVIVIITLIVRFRRKKQSPSSGQSGPAPASRAGTGMIPEGPALCAGCGHQNPRDHNFCEQCGEKLG